MDKRPLILLIFANDPTEPLAEVQQEMQSLQNILHPVAERLQYDIQILEYSSVDSLIQQLDDNRDRLVLLHFAGHSNSEVLKLDQGVAHASGLVDKLRACRHLKLLFLNGCNNAQQVQQFVEIGIPATIGTSVPIVDKMAREFSEYFYTELAKRRMPVSSAFEQARATITTKKGEQHQTLNMRSLDESITTGYQPEWSWFLEQTHEHDWKLEEAAHPCNRLPVLPTKSLAQLPDEPFKNLYYYTPDDAEIFFGRCQPALDILECLTDERHPLLLLHGGSGVGKSSFLMAGLIPRLRARQQPASDPTRYDEKLNLTPQYLLANLFGSDDPDVIHKQLDATGEQPAIWILDQLEEIFFKPESEEDGKPGNDVASTLSKDDQQDNIPDALNQLLKILQTLFPHNQPERWPNARIILSLRTEWFGELHDACRRYQLGSRDYLLKPLSKADIIEVIEQPARTPLLVKKYGLQIEQLPNGRLAEQIADDLLEDKGSNIAPPLQIMLSKLWQRVEHLPVDERIWTQVLYEQQKAQGLLLSEHLDQQLREIGEFGAWGKPAYDSGLLLDVLHAHTTLQGTAKTLPSTEYNKRYTHIPFREKLAKAFTNHYLLVDPLNDKKQLRLAHDSLAAVVKVRYETSDLPGQRAQRVLHSRKSDWKQVNKDEYKGTALDTYDLKLVEQGENGTRDWQQDPKEKAIVLKSRKKRRNGRIAVGSVVATLVLAFVATVFLYLQAEEQRRLTEEQVLETNYSLAKAFEEKSLLSLNQWQETKDATSFRKAWLYALEAQSGTYPAGRMPVVPKLLGRQAQYLSMNTERKQTPSIKLGDIRALAYSPDGKILASGAADPETSAYTMVRLWDTDSGGNLAVLEGHTNGITALAFSPDGKTIVSGSYDKTIKLWDARTGKALNTLQGHSDPVTTVAYSPDGGVIASGSRDSTIRLWNGHNGELLAVLQGHEGPLMALAYRSDGQAIASGSLDGTIRLWDAAGGEALSILQGHESGVTTVAYSPDRQVIASGSQDNSIRLWNAQTGEALHHLQGHAKTIWALAYSTDGKVIASGSNDKTIVLWDANSGESLKVLEQHTEGVTALTYSPDGQQLASGSFDESIRLWDVDGNALTDLQGHTHQISGIAHSPDGSRIVSGSLDDIVRIWDAQTGKTLSILRGHTDDVWEVSYSPDGKTIVSAAWDNTARLWDAESGEALMALQHESAVTGLSYQPDGQILTTGTLEGKIHFWNAQTGGSLGVVEGHSGAITRLRYSPDGKIIATASHDQTVRLWNAENGEALKVLKGHTSQVWTLAFSPDGQVLGSGAADNTIRLWNAGSGDALGVLKGHTEKVVALAFSPDGELLASGSQDNTMRLWNSKTGENLSSLHHAYAASALSYSPDGTTLVSGAGDGGLNFWNAFSNTVHTLQGHSAAVTSISHSPDGKVIASASFDDSVRLWDTRTGELLKKIEHLQVMKLAFSPTEKMIASGSRDGTIKLWDAASGELLNTFQGHAEAIIAITGYNQEAIASLTFSPDGQVLAAGLDDNTIRLFAVADGEALGVLTGHGGTVSGLAYSPDGQILASGSHDHSIRLWDVNSRELIKTLSAHTGAVYGLAYAPDGRTLASGSNDNTVRLWDIPSGDVQNTLQGHASLITSLAFSPDGRVLTSGSTDSTIMLWDMDSGGTLLSILQGHTSGVMSLSFSMDGQQLASGSIDESIRLWNLSSAEHRLLYDFDPKAVSAALQFLWQMKLEALNFVDNSHALSLLPQMGQHVTFTAQTKKYASLLQAPRPTETKLDQLVRLLEDQNAYKKPEQLLSENSNAYLSEMARRLRLIADQDNVNSRAYDSNQLWKDAEERYKKAIEIYRSLATADKNLYRPYLANILNNLGYDLSEQIQRRAEVELFLTEALSIYRQLAQEDPEKHTVVLVAILESIGHAHIQWQEYPQAKVYLDEALEILIPLVEKAPEGTLDWVYNDIKNSLEKVNE